MKACAPNRKPLALLAIGALGDSECEALRDHVAECAGCRAYLRELDQVAQKVRAAEAPAPDPSPFLHRRVRHRLLEERPRSNFPRRLMIPAVAAFVFVMFVLPHLRSAAPISRTASAPVAAVNPADPTILNYQMAANESLDRLDALLNAQANRALPSTPVYRAGSLGNAAD